MRRRASWRSVPASPTPGQVLPALIIFAIGLGILSWLVAYHLWGGLL